MTVCDTQVEVDSVISFLRQWQDDVCAMLNDVCGACDFKVDQWQYDGGGGGESRVVEGHPILEKGGVNFSHIKGASLPEAATRRRATLVDAPFEAMGVSLVMHPQNPYVPTVHANLRLFVAYPENEAPIWWFGGGADLTPYYGFVEDCQMWHACMQKACAPYDPECYHEFKSLCDQYFFLPHRQEARGIGGLFFDDVNRWSFDTCFSFIQSVAKQWLVAYREIVQRRMSTPYGERERDFQTFRRGRYAEFNLLYDRGTAFGLQSKGRTESILMSMPPLVQWKYDYHPEPGSAEAALYADFLPVKAWVQS